MARIIDITPKARDVKPILLLFTSHRLDCFLLCLKCLELYTDLGRFQRIYVLANAVSDEHAAIIAAFKRRHSGVVDVHLTPRGEVPAMLAMQNFIVGRHPDEVFVALEEDVFVTPSWLEHLLATYKMHAGREDVAAVAPLMPLTRTGRQCMARLVRAHFRQEARRLPALHVEKNAPYHRFVWEKVLEGGFVEKYFSLEKPRAYYLSHVSTNCVLFDRRLSRVVFPMPLKAIPGVARHAELHVNAALRHAGLKAAVVTGAVVHHYAHRGCEEFLRRHVSLDDIWWHLTGLEDSSAYRDRTRFTPRPNAASREVLRLMREREMRVLA